MANEFVHGSVGTSMTQAEFEAVGLHVLNSQATGDLIYASSATQLSRLAIGAADTVLTCNGTIPAWSATPILNTAVAKGTWTASGTWTIPAVTLDGTYVFTVGNTVTFRRANDMFMYLDANAANKGSIIFFGQQSVYKALIGLPYDTTSLTISTHNAAAADIKRIEISTSVDTAVVTWSAITQVGLVLGGPLDAAANYMSFTEMAAPGAGAANTARIYAVVDGGTLTDLAAVFQDGTVDIFAQEVTPLDAPTFTYPSGTEAKIVLRKGHPGLVTLVAKFPNGKEFVVKEYQYHDADKVAANNGCERPLPADWEITTAEERLAKVKAEALAKLESEKNVVLPQAEARK